MEFITFTPDSNTNNAWGYLNAKIGNKYAAAGLMAAMYVVSNCDPYFGWTKYRGYLSTDETCFMKDFVHDKKPFGIGGWRTWTRKQGLFNYARRMGKPIHDIDLQLFFVMDEFSGMAYRETLDKLRGVENAVDAFTISLKEYMDIPKKTAVEMANHYQKVVEDILEHYDKPRVFKAPKQYVKTEFVGVSVKGQKTKKFQLFRKKLGIMEQNELYPFLIVSDGGDEYVIHYNGRIGYVKTDKTYVVTRMEEVTQ